MAGHADRHMLMGAPDHFEVCYSINPWMSPEAWARDPRAAKHAAVQEWWTLRRLLTASGQTVAVIPAQPGLPDLVFLANAAVVLDGRALMGRFRCPERRGEELHFLRFFEALRARGLLCEVARVDAGVFQEGAGDCIWDATRGFFWAGYGPRSSANSVDAIARFFGHPVVALHLVTEKFYHLDVGFCPLPGGELLYYPPALSRAARATVRERVPADLRLEVSADEADSMCLNAIAIGRVLIMAPAPARIRDLLTERGYQCRETPLQSFRLSGGAAYCLSLRLDLTSDSGGRADAPEPLSRRLYR